MSAADDLVAGRWELLDPIASGSTSTVWRAVDHRLGQECAAKVLRRREAGELLRFVREQSVRLEHPRVVAPYGWAADDGTVLIASELLDGGSLLTLIGDHGPLDDATVVSVLDQLLDALAAVHGAGIIHRDVKPGNVLLRAGSGPLDIALTDFGIALAASDTRLTSVGMVVGTPGYLPPEVLSGAAHPEKAHDLYALGRLAVALVVGHESGRRGEALAAVGDPALRDALEALLADDPGARPRSVAAAQALLAPAARTDDPRGRDGEPVVVLRQLPDPDGALPEAHAAAVPAPTPVRRPRRRMVLAVVSPVVALLAGGVLWAAMTQEDPGPSPPGNEEACTWQQEGDRRQEASGTLVCTRTDDGYVWREDP